MTEPKRVDLAGPVYILGPMSGLPDYNIPAFKAMEKWLLENYPGIEVKSPHHNSYIGGMPGELPYGFYFRQGLQQLAVCESVVCLPGWLSSRGGKTEMMCAELMGLPTYQAQTSAVGSDPFLFLIDFSLFPEYDKP